MKTVKKMLRGQEGIRFDVTSGHLKHSWIAAATRISAVISSFLGLLPGSDSSAKAMMCSPSMSSSCGRYENRVSGASEPRPYTFLASLSEFLPRFRTCCGVAASSGSALKGTEGR